MSIEELYSVLNKRGFFNTFLVLSQFEEYKAEKGVFYRNLIDFSNYNSFLRIKDKLLEAELINLDNLKHIDQHGTRNITPGNQTYC